MVDARDGPEWRGHRPRSIKLRGRGSKFVLDLPGSDRKSDANPMRFRFKADADPRMFRLRLRELPERCVLEPRPVSDHSWRATPRSESSRLVGETAVIPERSGFLCAGILESRVHTWFRLGPLGLLVPLGLLGLLVPLGLLNQRSKNRVSWASCRTRPRVRWHRCGDNGLGRSVREHR